jgi:bacterioferritin
MSVDKPFTPDVARMRAVARRHLESGAVTEDYAPDRAAVVRLLDDALATELVCMLRYRRHYFMAQRLANPGVVAQFLEHSTQEQAHADRLAARIVQLNGEPDLDPSRFASRSHTEYVAGTTLVQMIEEDLVAERVAIESYRSMIQWLGDRDPTTRRMLEEILAVEEEHADEMADLLSIASAVPAPAPDPAAGNGPVV